MQDSVNIRKLSVELIMLILEDGEFENVVLDGFQAKYSYLPESDRRYVVLAVKGVIEKKLELDFYIKTLTNQRVNKLKKPIRNILRLALYEIKYIDKSKEYAVVNEAVKLAKKMGYPQFKGFVNGVLRNFIRQIDEIKPNTLEAKYSVPNWIVELWKKELGETETIKCLDALSEVQPLTVRLNPRKGTYEEILSEMKEEGFELEPFEKKHGIYKLSGIKSLSTSKALNEGKFYIQDYSSMLPCINAGIKLGDSVIDVCAAPGGKSIFASELTGETGNVVSCDISGKKTTIIKANAMKMGASNIEVVTADASKFNSEFEEKFDVAILDLPCSGLGVIGRKADLRYRVKEEDLLELQSIQRSIIDNAKRYVKKGGRMVFSTCTIDKLENEDNKDYILETCMDFKLVSEQKVLPYEFGSDGFYITVFERD